MNGANSPTTAILPYIVSCRMKTRLHISMLRANGNNSSAMSTPGAGLEPREVSFACTVWFCMIVAYAALQLSAPFAPDTSAAFRTRYFGSDFAEFYIAGKILNQHGADALYDLGLQTRMFRDWTLATMTLRCGTFARRIWLRSSAPSRCFLIALPMQPG